jgi:hypothetical protein
LFERLFSHQSLACDSCLIGKSPTSLMLASPIAS